MKPEERLALERQILEKLAAIRHRMAPDSIAALRRAVSPAEGAINTAGAAEIPPKVSALTLAAMKAYRSGRG